MNEHTEIIKQKARCPHCKTVFNYKVLIEKTLIQAVSAFGSCIHGLLFSLIGLSLLLSGGWKILGLAVLGAVFFAVCDYFINCVVWRCVELVTKAREITIRKFTLKLKCQLCKNEFQVLVSLPIERGNYNVFSVTHLEG